MFFGGLTIAINGFQCFFILLPSASSLSMVFDGSGPLVKRCDGFNGSLWSIAIRQKNQKSNLACDGDNEDNSDGKGGSLCTVESSSVPGFLISILFTTIILSIFDLKAST